MERGETEGRITTNLRALFASQPSGAAGFNLILQTGMQVDKDQPERSAAAQSGAFAERQARVRLHLPHHGAGAPGRHQ